MRRQSVNHPLDCCRLLQAHKKSLSWYTHAQRSCRQVGGSLPGACGLQRAAWQLHGANPLRQQPQARPMGSYSAPSTPTTAEEQKVQHDFGAHPVARPLGILVGSTTIAGRTTTYLAAASHATQGLPPGAWKLFSASRSNARALGMVRRPKAPLDQHTSTRDGCYADYEDQNEPGASHGSSQYGL